MQIKGKYSWVKHLDFLCIDLLSLIVAFLISYSIKFGTLSLSTNWMHLLVIISLLNVVISLFINPYSGIFRRRYYQEIGRSAVLVGVNALITMVVFFLLKIGADYSREVILETYLLYYLIALVLKYVWKQLLTSGKIRTRVTETMSMFVITDREHAEQDLRNASAGDLPLYDIKAVHLVDDGDGSVTVEDEKGRPVEIPVIGENYVKYILDQNIQQVLFLVPPEQVEPGVCDLLDRNGVSLNIVVERILGFQPEDQFISNIGVYKAVSTSAFSFTPAQQFYLLVKRLFDILCGLVGLVVLVPVTLGVKLANLLHGDHAKLFYRQRRVGREGKEIRIWKFRSMVPNADEVLQEMLKEEKWRKEWDENQKFEDDPRITKVGQVLRKTSIDELPQLFNVLMGDMSLVGPRPLVFGELEAHDGLKLYQKVKPGITGWWGCNGRSNIDYRERLDLEYYYVRNCSFHLDVVCILRTAWAVLKKDGAH